MILEIIVAVVLAGFFGWAFGFITFLHRYQIQGRCYLCDKIITIKTFQTCEECDAHTRTLSDLNLVRELYQVTNRIEEVETYRIEGLVTAYQGNERYTEVNETIVASEDFINLFQNLAKVSGENSLKIEIGTNYYNRKLGK